MTRVSAVLAVICALATAPSPARAQAVDGHCETPQSASAQTGVALPTLPYLPPDFEVAGRNARPIEGAILNGAVYDRKGQLLCVLPTSQPGAFVADGNYVAGQVPASLCANWSAGNLDGLTRLRLSNNDVLRRLIWLTAEGGCYPTRLFCPGRGSAGCHASDPREYGSRYFAYVLKNMRNSVHYRSGRPKFESDEQMLRMNANSGHGTGYARYFVNGDGNARFIHPAVLRPSTWDPNPYPGAPSCRPEEGDERSACFTRRHLSRCLADVIGAELDEDDSESPFRNDDGTPDRLRVRWTSGMNHRNASTADTEFGACRTGRPRVQLSRVDAAHPERTSNAHCFGLPLDHPDTGRR